MVMFISLSSLLSVLCLGFLVSSHGASPYRTLTTSKLKGITTSTIELIIEDAEGIMVERVPDTPSHTFVQAFIKSKFSGKWLIETDTFESETPLGKKSFTNIIATHTSCPDCDFIVLAAHYDSKYFKDINFVAATDSAIPCAMLIDIARSLESLVETSKKKLGVKIVFFDGEEAFVKWTDSDSIYGARHLAEKWEKTTTPDGDTLISKIDSLVLLDLLGAAKPNFYKFSATSSQLYDHIADVEQRLLKKQVTSLGPFFSKQQINDQVQDDHIPFLKRGVQVLHIIPIPFPKTWHTHLDDRASIDLPTIDTLAKILKVFVAEHLQL